MAKLISCKKSKTWGKEHNGANLYVVSMYFSNQSSKWNIMGLSSQYHLNVSLSADDAEEAKKQLEELKSDTEFHESVKCYDFSIEELTKDTEYACTSVDVGDNIKNMTMRNVASPMDKDQTFAKERARVLRLFAKGKWKEHTEG